MSAIACEACGRSFEPKTKRSRFCYRLGCVRARERAKKRRQRSPVRLVEPLPPGEMSVEFQVRAELEAVGKHTSAVGASLLVLARRLDAPGDDSGSSIAALHRALRDGMYDLTGSSKWAPDDLDELRERRARRRQGDS